MQSLLWFLYALQEAIVLGAGAPSCGEYESFIFYHNNSPRWSETFKVGVVIITCLELSFSDHGIDF